MLHFFLIILFILNPAFAKNKFKKIIDLEKSKKTINLLTFNTGLAHTFVPYANQRSPQIIRALKDGNADIVCLQEVWTQDDRNSFIFGLKDKYPYSFINPIIQMPVSKKPACSISEIFGKNKYGRCLVDNCIKKSGDQLTACLIENCRKPLDELKDNNNQCANALLAQVGLPSWKALYNIFNPFKYAGLFAYDGSDGIMLLSKYPIEKKENLNWDNLSTLNRRNVLLANIKIREKDYQVACTHLTANLGKSVPYVGKKISFENENSNQIDEILNKVKQTSLTTILMGDFNCSIKIDRAGVDPDFEKNCQKIFKKYSSPVLKINPQCTFCKKNLINASSLEGNLMIDHIFLKGSEPKKVDIVFKEIITIKDNDKEVQTQLSDHYGVSVHISN